MSLADTCPSCALETPAGARFCPRCGERIEVLRRDGETRAPTDSERELEPGDVVAGYRILGLAGHGGMGVVYRAEDETLGRPAALKVIAPEFARDAGFRERFQRESRIAARLEHPNVVPVYRAGDESGRLFIAMRFVAGTDLAALIRAGALPPTRAADLTAQIAGALDAAHARGLVHRDVKPANVLLDQAGEHAYLTDFGLTVEASAGRGGLTQTGQWVGTLAYISPEQIRGEGIDARSDVYSLGAVLFQMLTGRLPFALAGELEMLGAHLDQPPPRPSVHGAPRAFDRVIERAMAKDPAERYRSAGDLGRAAVASAAGERARLAERSVATGAAAPDGTGKRRPSARTRRRRAMAISLGSAVIVAGGAAAIASSLAGGGTGTTPPGNPAGQVVGEPIALPVSPDRLSVANGQVWALQQRGGVMARVGTTSEQVTEFTPAVDLGGGVFLDLVAQEDGVWVTHSGAAVGGVDRTDPETGAAVQHVRIPDPLDVGGEGRIIWVTAGDSARSPGRLVAVDSRANRVEGAPVSVGRGPRALAVGSGAVWVANARAGSVWRVDPGSRRVIAKIPVGASPSALGVGAGGVWVINAEDRTITRIDPASNDVEGQPISLGKELNDIVVTKAAVWVSSADGTITRLDPATGTIVGQPIAAGTAPLSLAASDHEVWVGSAEDRALRRVVEAE